jgi:hypothetical protein
VLTVEPEDNDHIRIVESADPEANLLPSGENTTEITLWECPFRIITQDPFDSDHRRMV